MNPRGNALLVEYVVRDDDEQATEAAPAPEQAAPDLPGWAGCFGLLSRMAAPAADYKSVLMEVGNEHSDLRPVRR